MQKFSDCEPPKLTKQCGQPKKKGSDEMNMGRKVKKPVDIVGKRVTIAGTVEMPCQVDHQAIVPIVVVAVAVATLVLVMGWGSSFHGMQVINEKNHSIQVKSLKENEKTLGEGELWERGKMVFSGESG
jgi:hypothetical protein